MTNLILTTDLVPKTSFYNNLRKVVSQETWDVLRKSTYSKYEVSCGICGVKDVVLDCHEIWEYNEKKLIQKLVGLIALCKPCHQIKHYGHSQILAEQGKLDLIELGNHFMKVNNCSEADYKKHIRESIRLWREKSKKQWKVDLGEYRQYVTES